MRWHRLAPWALAGLTLTLAGSVVTLEISRIAASVPAVADLPESIWWQSPAVLAALISGMVLTAAALVLVQQRVTLARGRDESRRIADALAALSSNPRSAWQTLREKDVIDGHALWDGDDRLVDFSGFLGRYIPHLSHWRSPTGRQLVAAMIDSGRMALLPGRDRDQTLDAYCAIRQQIPGLRELRMTDGQVYLARSVDLGQGLRASVFTNISTLRRSGDGLTAGDAFRQVFDQAPLAKVLLGADMRPLATNRAFTALLGHSADSLVRLGWNGLLHADEPADTPPWSIGLHRLMTADGGTVRVAIGVQQLVDELSGANGGLLVSLEDVTARLENEDRLRLKTAVLDLVSNAVLAVDRSGRVAYGNAAARTLFQWSNSILPGTPVERLLGAATRAALDGNGTELETEGSTWNGTAFPAQVCITRAGEASPLPGGAVLVVADLTPRRALDLQLMHSARLATLGEMAASIAHEFNQCLHVIRLASEAVQLDIADHRLDSERLSKRAENILSQVDRLTEMVSHMRTISRREGQDKKPFLPQAAVDSALRMVEPLLKVDGIRVLRHGHLDGLSVLGHQVRLEQVLLNLLNNGRDAIRERFRSQGNSGGGGTITITCTITPDQSRLAVAVRDDGTGIATNVGAHIFEPFVTTKEGGHGLGLGLSISRGICTEMGGSLTFRNVEDGAEFVIDLPVAVAATGQAIAPSPIKPAGWGDDADGEDDLGDERRVLLVDDEALSVMMVAEFLHRQGYGVDTAYDGVEAYELCQNHVYHAVITDIRMPRMDGHELIAKLEDLQPGTPVIVVTGHLKDSNAGNLGGNVVALLAKPFQLQDLREQLQRLDKQHEERQEVGSIT